MGRARRTSPAADLLCSVAMKRWSRRSCAGHLVRRKPQPAGRPPTRRSSTKHTLYLCSNNCTCDESWLLGTGLSRQGAQTSDRSIHGRPIPVQPDNTPAISPAKHTIFTPCSIRAACIWSAHIPVLRKNQDRAPATTVRYHRCKAQSQSLNATTTPFDFTTHQIHAL